MSNSLQEWSVSKQVGVSLGIADFQESVCVEEVYRRHIWHTGFKRRLARCGIAPAWWPSSGLAVRL